MTIDQFRKGLADPDAEVRAYLVGKLVRQAKPDDVFLFVRLREIWALWPRLIRYLGRTREFWSWLFETWEGQGRVGVSDGPATCIVDLVAEPFSPIAAPEQAFIEGVAISVDGKHELLAAKLATLLERSEIRDLVGVKALLEVGGDLDAAVRDAPRKDAGFSPLTLAWVLKTYEVDPAVRALGWSAAHQQELRSFKQEMIERLTVGAAPQ